MEHNAVARGSVAARWGAVCVFALASTWNYLDRQLLAAAAPRIKAEFHLSNTGYGWLGAAFGLAYALASPALGWFLDRVGLEIGAAWAVGFWSVAAMICGWTRTFTQLLVSRVLLAIGESAGVPAAGKLNTIYLEPENRALGAAVTQVGLTIGSVVAPLLIAAIAGWRSPFFICGALGLFWIPLWLYVRRSVVPYQVVPPRPQAEGLGLIRDRRLKFLTVANMLWMVAYALWSTWTTIYIAETFHLSTRDANAYAWFPPVGSTLGGFVGGALSRRLIARGSSALDARIAAMRVCAFGCLICLAGPFCRTPLLATLVAAASYFWTTAGSVNLYTIPLDIWGGERAGVAISFLVFAYGLLQTGISPLIGAIVDRYGFDPVYGMLAIPPFLGLMCLQKLKGGREAALRSMSVPES
ncbi:MAG TPA: MFS transporter [Bryobacteraceae bacterium]|nr:MFS transporter [Bryobacteraceae bacterium]